jgi:hypothetical protein
MVRGVGACGLGEEERREGGVGPWLWILSSDLLRRLGGCSPMMATRFPSFGTLPCDLWC